MFGLRNLACSGQLRIVLLRKGEWHALSTLVPDSIGGRGAWAEAHGISKQYVNNVLQGWDKPGGAILAALGLRRVVTYERIGG